MAYGYIPLPVVKIACEPEVVLALPVSNAWPQRVGSQMKLTKSIGE